MDNSNKKTYSIEQKYQINMLKNLNHMYFSHYKTIKYLGFKLIIYVIDLSVASSSKVFNEFDSMFLLNVNKLLLL